MVVCSLAVAASLVFAPLGTLALTVFVLSLPSTFAGLCLVLAELRVSLDVVEFEHGNLMRLRAGEGLLAAELSGSDEPNQGDELW